MLFRHRSGFLAAFQGSLRSFYGKEPESPNEILSIDFPAHFLVLLRVALSSHFKDGQSRANPSGEESELRIARVGGLWGLFAGAVGSDEAVGFG